MCPDARTLVEYIAKLLVDAPDEVLVYQVEEDGETDHRAGSRPRRYGQGDRQNGRTVRALRSLVNAAGFRLNKRFELEILE